MKTAFLFIIISKLEFTIANYNYRELICNFQDAARPPKWTALSKEWCKQYLDIEVQWNYAKVLILWNVFWSLNQYV